MLTKTDTGFRLVACADSGRLAEARTLHEELRTKRAQVYIPYFSIAISASAIGDMDGAIEYAQQACDEREPALHAHEPVPSQRRRRVRRELAVEVRERGRVGQPHVVAEHCDGLRERGAEVDVVPLYDTVAEPLTDAQQEALARATYVTFTSSSTVRFLLESGGRVGGARVVSIGPVTSATLREHGIEPDAEAERHDIEGLIAAILEDVQR